MVSGHTHTPRKCLLLVPILSWQAIDTGLHYTPGWVSEGPSSFCPSRLVAASRASCPHRLLIPSHLLWNTVGSVFYSACCTHGSMTVSREQAVPERNVLFSQADSAGDRRTRHLAFGKALDRPCEILTAKWICVGLVLRRSLRMHLKGKGPLMITKGE